MTQPPNLKSLPRIAFLRRQSRELPTNKSKTADSLILLPAGLKTQYKKGIKLRTLPPMFFVYGDCTGNHTVKKYNSYRVNSCQKA